MVISNMQGDAVDLEGLMGLFFRGHYKAIAIRSLQTLQQRRMTTKELAEVIGESRTSVSDVVKRMERLLILNAPSNLREIMEAGPPADTVTEMRRPRGPLCALRSRLRT